MPEGDTIHAAARRLDAVLTGRPLVALHVPRVPTRVRPAAGAPIASVTARGKYLLVRFGDDLTLLTHLRMTGRWRVLPRRGPVPAARAVVEVAEHRAVCTRAPVVELLDDDALRRHRELRALGPDLTVPGVDLDEVLSRLARLVTGGTAVGDALLDQRPACGVGNVVMQEACFLEGLDPRTRSDAIGPQTWRSLYARAAAVLQHNVETTRRTTVEGGPPGALYVYDRTDRPCRRCATPVTFGRPLRDARPTWWCPSCQPAAGVRADAAG